MKNILRYRRYWSWHVTNPIWHWKTAVLFSTSIDGYISYKNYCNWESYNISNCLSWIIIRIWKQNNKTTVDSNKQTTGYKNMPQETMSWSNEGSGEFHRIHSDQFFQLGESLWKQIWHKAVITDILIWHRKTQKHGQCQGQVGQSSYQIGTTQPWD